MSWRHSFLAPHMTRVNADRDLVLPCRGPVSDSIDGQALTPAAFYAQEGRRGLPGEDPGAPAGAPYFIPQPVYRFCLEPTKVPEAERDRPRDLAAIVARDLEARRQGQPLTKLPLLARDLEARRQGQALTKLPLLITGVTGSGKSISLGELFHWSTHPGGPGSGWWRGMLADVDRETNLTPERARDALGYSRFLRIDPADIQIESGGEDWVRLATAIARAATGERDIRADEQAVRRWYDWIRWSPPVLLVFDLNRGEQEHALQLARSALALAEAGLRNHRLAFIYRRQSAHTGDDKVWGLLDPDQGKSEAWDLRPLDLKSAAEYVYVVRRGAYLRRGGFAGGLAAEQAARDQDLFLGVAARFESHIGLPLLVYFLSLVDTLQDIQSVSQLYDRVVARFFSEELARCRASPDGGLASENDAKTVFYLCHVAAVEMARAKDDLSLDPATLVTKKGVAPPFLRPELPTYTEALWTEHLGDWYRKLGPDSGRWRDLLFKHSLLTQVGGSELRWIHDSFSYYFSARAFRFADSPGFPAGGKIAEEAAEPRAPDDELLRRLAAIISADPKLWFFRAEFLAGWLSPESLHELMFQHVLGEGAAPPGETALFDRLDADSYKSQILTLPVLERLSAGLCTSLGGITAHMEQEIARCGHMLADMTVTQEYVRREFSLRWSAIPRGPFPEERRRAEDAPITGRGARCRVDAWRAVARRVRTSRHYGGLELRDQSGLLPLGCDPKSELEEFAVEGTGELPWRDREGHVMLDEESALVLVLVPGASSARIGSPEDAAGRWDDEARREVALEPFFMAKFPVTQEQWHRVMEGSEVEARRRGAIQYSPHFFRGSVLPAESVSFEDCEAFCGELNGKLGLRSAFDLPSEAEWEYACRGGEAQYAPFYGPRGPSEELRSLGWFIGNSRFRLHRVGLKGANRWGFHDLHGNVLEWCKDRYAGSGFRVLRGGGWVSDARYCRSAYRRWVAPGYRGSLAGFRPARSLVRR